MASDYCIKIRQVNDNRLEQLCCSIPYDVFNIELEFRYVSHDLNCFQRFHQSVLYPRDMFLSEELGPKIVLSMFANTGASMEFLETVGHDVLSFAWETDIDPVNLDRKAIKLLVEVLVFGADDEDDQVIAESLNTLNFKPASRSSIQSLKRVKLGDEGLLPFKKRGRFEGLSSRKQCTICLDELLDGDEVAFMPCGHVYHCLESTLEAVGSLDVLEALLDSFCKLCNYFAE
ncbi:hypothetical protein PTKIN_Ptkin09bG0178600 [Pterospermum kingtungense]